MATRRKLCVRQCISKPWICAKIDEGVGKVKVKVNLEQSMKTQNGSRGIALLFLIPRR
jgi:hypothetical protein